MNKVQRFCLTALSSLALVTAVSAVPSGRHQDPPPAQSTAQAQSVSGKIASVSDTSFTLTVASSTAHQIQAAPSTTPKTMTFQIDKNTTVEGKLKVNSQADVTYRENNGQNVAISVRVTP